VEEHPLLRMWRDRLDAEIAEQQAWVAREARRAGWNEAWRSYKARLLERRDRVALPRRWNLTGWLPRLHAPADRTNPGWVPVLRTPLPPIL
jgi:hypothetical protein